MSFAHRHIGPSASDQAAMLATVGFDSLDDLMAATVPASIRSSDSALELPAPMTESAVLRKLRDLAEANNPAVSMIGMGYHPTATPAVIRRNVLEDPSWYTAYTPYQPEISQGRLEALLNFQTMVADLTGLPTANASLLDEGTAVAEAITLIRRAHAKSGSLPIVVDANLHPQTLAVVRTRSTAAGFELITRDLTVGLGDLDVAGVVIAYERTDGGLQDPRPLISAIHDRGGLAAVAADPMALVLLEAPGSMGADVVVGSTQRFGVPMFYGGPHAAFMAVREGLQRHLPGRLVGVSLDAAGRGAYRLALQTREQHIRREKATSNICTSQVLLAVAAGMYAVYHGPEGLRQIAKSIHAAAVRLADALTTGGVDLKHSEFFDTVTAKVPQRAASIVAAARGRGIHVRLVDADHVGISTNELTTDDHLAAVCAAFGVGAPAHSGVEGVALPQALERTAPIGTHPVFNEHHSETKLLRYLRTLSDRDYALDRGMIPLGSCTMKLNAACEMEPISYAGFADLHPFVPAEDAAGMIELIETLEAQLATCTGYAAVSVQPNAGSQGEFAGLRAIGAYHASRGESQRDVCLIPASAHGTNAASAVMAGMRVVIVKSTESGEVDLTDLGQRCAEYGDVLAAVMVTYPSTHGVYEDGIGQLCSIVHDAGGQVYVDGANLNALLGHAAPGEFGGDVSHLNLHKTFCIPHGGGGPGVGPVAVREHLVDFLPVHPLHPVESRRGEVGTISAAPYGSAGILPIPFAYIAMMGADGLRDATSVAVLSANYVATRLESTIPVLYTGHSGLVAHECILDTRGLTKAAGLTVDDIAKRLIDYGFHAPTMSFPVPGTLMVEPTESEDLAELDRFCDAMLAICKEIKAVQSGALDPGDNPLRNAPHTASELISWRHSYDIATGLFPTGQTQDKYWPPVARIDQAYGDRNLVCSCPPVEAFA